MTNRIDSDAAPFANKEAEDADTAQLLAELRRTQFGRIDAGRHVYLDYTGAGLYAESQLDEHVSLLRKHTFGNPHSANLTSSAASELVASARTAVLAFFRADPTEYEVIFTPNATGALRLVGEAYPFVSGSRFLLTFDNHNSVNGIREFARARRGETTYVPIVAPDLRVDEELLARYLIDSGGGRDSLFAYPAQSNFSGVQHPLEWVDLAHAHGWDVLLDAAAFVPTNRLDLSHVHPDYVCLSFYKMFGWPTGIGAPPRAARRSTSWPAPGSRAARSLPPLFSDHGTSRHSAPPTSKTAPSTSSIFRRSRSAYACSLRSASSGSTRTCKRSPRGSWAHSDRSDTRMALRRLQSTVRSGFNSVERRLRSTSSTQTAVSLMNGTSTRSRATTVSRCVLAASATQEQGRLHS